MTEREIQITDSRPLRGQQVHFYENEQTLTQNLFELVKVGLRHGDAIVLVCTEAHGRVLVPAFPEALASGQLCTLSADNLLEEVTDPNSSINEQRFKQALYRFYATIPAGFTRVRIFSELVQILCANSGCGRHAN